LSLYSPFEGGSPASFFVEPPPAPSFGGQACPSSKERGEMNCSPPVFRRGVPTFCRDGVVLSVQSQHPTLSPSPVTAWRGRRMQHHGCCTPKKIEGSEVFHFLFLPHNYTLLIVNYWGGYTASRCIKPPKMRFSRFKQRPQWSCNNVLIVPIEINSSISFFSFHRVLRPLWFKHKAGRRT